MRGKLHKVIIINNLKGLLAFSERKAKKKKKGFVGKNKIKTYLSILSTRNCV